MSRTTQICFWLWGPYGQSIGEVGPSIRCYTHEWHIWWLFLMGLGPYWAIYKSSTAQLLVLFAQLFLLLAKTSPAVLFLIKQPLWHLISFASRALSDPFFDHHLIQPSSSVLSYLLHECFRSHDNLIHNQFFIKRSGALCSWWWKTLILHSYLI